MAGRGSSKSNRGNSALKPPVTRSSITVDQPEMDPNLEVLAGEATLENILLTIKSNHDDVSTKLRNLNDSVRSIQQKVGAQATAIAAVQKQADYNSD